jgi:hypothetical protein
LTFEWDGGEAHGTYTALDFPEFDELISDAAKQHSRWIEFSKDQNFPHTKNPALAKKTSLRMQKWFRFQNQGNGAGFCLDTPINPAPVLFDQHAWFDGGAGDNGHVIGVSLLDFFHQWSRVCFQEPPGAWWPGVFLHRSGIDWESNKFASTFRLCSNAVRMSSV